MSVQKEDVEKFLQGNPAFASQYFSKKVSEFQELSQVNEIKMKIFFLR